MLFRSCHVVEISNTTSLIFTANTKTTPQVGPVANVSCVKIVGNTVGYTAMVQYAETMAASSSSPGMGSSPSGGGGGGGAGQIAGKLQGMMGNLFGRSSGTMQDMWGRLSKSGEQEAKKMHQKLNQDMSPKKMSKIAEDTANGTDPLKNIMNWTKQG